VKRIIAIACVVLMLLAATASNTLALGPTAGHGDGGVTAGHGDGAITAGHGDGGVSAGHGDGGATV